MSNENANTVYGRLLESVHISNYSTDRACDELEYLLEEDRWKQVGHGYDDISEFARSLNPKDEQMRFARDRRKKLAETLDKLGASQRATAKALGVNESTVRLDLGKKQQAADISATKASVTQAEVSENHKSADLSAPTRLPFQVDAEDVSKATKGVIKNEEKQIKSVERQEYRAEIAQKGAAVPASDRWNVYHDDMTTWKAPRQYDWIITDPPYPKEFLPLWSDLARRSVEWLKDGGLLVAMSGQSYLDDIYEMLSEHLDYYWTAAYLTPGQPTPLRQVNVNTTWKPMLIFSKGKYAGKIFGDVFKSGGNDKDSHKWGQSVSGMFDVVSKLCLPGEWILDPFCGAGTTGIAALQHGCLFHGVEMDEQNVNISKGRLNDA